MPELAENRCRWPWGVAALVILLVCLPLAWSFRPLTASEKRLIGRWSRPPEIETDLPVPHLTFASDRNFEWMEGCVPWAGPWSFDGRKLTLFWHQRTQLYNRPSVSYELTFHDDGSFTMTYPTGHDQQWFPVSK